MITTISTLASLLATLAMRSLIITLLVAFLGGCASKADKEQLLEKFSETELYQISSKEMNDESYSEAIKTLRVLESHYPFGTFAQQAQLDIIYAYFKNSEYDASKAAADRFIRLHHQHANADYAYYMRGLSSNMSSTGILDRYLPIDISSRDPGQARLSLNEFSDLLSLYPNSKYAHDARYRITLLENRLAKYEIHSAKYYLKRKAFVAAANRGRHVVENMQQTQAVPEALAIMVISYRHLNLLDSAERAFSVLQLNYPNNIKLDRKGKFVGYKKSGSTDDESLKEVDTPKPPVIK